MILRRSRASLPRRLVQRGVAAPVAVMARRRLARRSRLPSRRPRARPRPGVPREAPSFVGGGALHMTPARRVSVSRTVSGDPPRVALRRMSKVRRGYVPVVSLPRFFECSKSEYQEFGLVIYPIRVVKRRVGAKCRETHTPTHLRRHRHSACRSRGGHHAVPSRIRAPHCPGCARDGGGLLRAPRA